LATSLGLVICGRCSGCCKRQAPPGFRAAFYLRGFRFAQTMNFHYLCPGAAIRFPAAVIQHGSVDHVYACNADAQTGWLTPGISSALVDPWGIAQLSARGCSPDGSLF